MRVSFFVALLGVSALVAVVLAQGSYPHGAMRGGYPAKIDGVYKRTACECTSAATTGQLCDDNWAQQYEMTLVEGTRGFSAQRPGATPPDPLGFSGNTNPHTGITIFTVNGLECEGVFGREFLCLNDQDEEACRVTFSCEEGDCAVWVVHQNIRSIMYPLLTILLGVAWAALGIPFLKDLLGGFSFILVLAFSGAQAVLMYFVIFTPAIYHGLVVIATAAFQIFGAMRGKWTIVALAALFNFFFLGGINVFVGFKDEFGVLKWVPFDILLSYAFCVTHYFLDYISYWQSDACYLYFGVTDEEPRCVSYISFALFCIAMALFLQPFIGVFAMSKLKGESSKKSVKSIELKSRAKRHK